MFITKAKLEWLEEHIKVLEDRYWFLLQRHHNLLSHLNLSECEVPARTELRSKVSAEVSVKNTNRR